MPRTVRRSLRISALEGTLAEVVAACSTGGVLTAWALALGLSPFLFGILGALPYLAQVLHMPAAWLSRRHGARRTALVAITLSRQALLPLAVLPFLPVSEPTRKAVFLAVAFASAALSIVGNNGWTTWMSELVPAPVRGRYFGRRTALCALAATGASLAAGLWLDGAQGSSAPLRLALLSLTACVAGAITTALLMRQEDAPALVTAAPRLRDVLAPLHEDAPRRFLAFQLAWSFASGLAAAFYPLHMVGNLRMGFALVALYNAGVAASRMIASPLFGRALDRVGARPVLVSCSIALCISPLIWVFPTAGRLWPLAIDAVLCGSAMAGYNLAMFSLPATLAPKDHRAFFFATVATAGGFATALSSAAGGGLVHLLPASASVLGQPVVSSNLLFLFGGVLRAFAVLFALRIEEKGARPVSDLARLVLRRAPPARARLAA